MVSHFNLLRQALAAATLLALSAASSADVTARVDRPTVDLNESFTLEIEVNESTDLEPDLSVLDENFHVGQVSKLSNTSIFNGEIRRTLTWTIALMPKVTGTQQVPPISLGNEQSNPVTIIVNEPTNAPPGEADVFVTSEVDVDETYVQAQILYRIRIYRAVATRQPALREPTITGAEALVELALARIVRVATAPQPVTDTSPDRRALEDGLERGIRAKVSTFARHHVNAKLTKGKTCGDYVNSILAKRESILDGYDEAIMLAPNGLIAECTGENIFVARHGKLLTPPLSETKERSAETPRLPGISPRNRLPPA